MRLPLPQFSIKGQIRSQFAEVIETATTEFFSQCLEPESLSFATMPPFGSWVKSRDEDSENLIYAVVYHATTTPIDSIHRARALGLSLQELQEQQPQIFGMLKTEFRSAIVGFKMPPQSINSNRSSPGKIYQYLPPRPPQIHQAVYYCEPDEVIEFSEKLDFLRTLLEISNAPIDALVGATIRQIYQLRKLDRAWLIQAGRSLSILLKDDYDRLRTILSQINP